MKIILKKEVAKLGHEGEIVKVKDGYAVNYLVPQGLAAVATPAVIRQYEETVRQRAHKEAALQAAAEALAAKISSLLVKVAVKVSENGRIYGSITTIQLAEALAAAGIEGADKKNIVLLTEGIKELGIYEAEYKCYKEVKGVFKFEVIAEA